ncbi:MAG: tetratricopeptide repeat protein [Rhodobacteraceae bacterium]|nr:tetratricopeptide repeat protein [Paracoccaceae bacterium]
MRNPRMAILCLSGTVFLAACDGMGTRSDVERRLADVNVIEETNLSSVMLSAANPDEAVTYFRRASEARPDRIDLVRGLAMSLMRAGKPTEAVAAWNRAIALPDAGPDDQVGLADALIRSNEWTRAKEVLNAIPPTHETFDRYRLEAMVADSNKQWDRADSFYETAVGLTTRPAGVMNNWGFSKLTRGDFAGAERLFTEAITYDSSLFTAKNNLVLARGAQRRYQLPIIPMSQTERAELLHTMALTAIKQGDVAIGKGLLEEALETHPQHFEAAARSLQALERGAIVR